MILSARELQYKRRILTVEVSRCARPFSKSFPCGNRPRRLLRNALQVLATTAQQVASCNHRSEPGGVLSRHRTAAFFAIAVMFLCGPRHHALGSPTPDGGSPPSASAASSSFRRAFGDTRTAGFAKDCRDARPTSSICLSVFLRSLSYIAALACGGHFRLELAACVLREVGEIPGRAHERCHPHGPARRRPTSGDRSGTARPCLSGTRVLAPSPRTCVVNSAWRRGTWP